MIYCIGMTERYEKALAAPTPPIKRAADGDYAGGWVWATPEEARRFIAMNGLGATHSVYGVKADWDADTLAKPGEPWRRLARDAEVTRLV